MPELISEKELEDYIFESRKNSLMGCAYDPIQDEMHDYCFRQVNMGLYGRADLIYVKFGKKITITIVELKKDLITTPTVAQISKYKKGLEHYFKKHLETIDIKGIVVGRTTVSDNKELDTLFLITSIDWLSLYLYETTLEFGVVFTKIMKKCYGLEGFSSIKEIIKQNKSAFLNKYKKCVGR